MTLEKVIWKAFSFEELFLLDSTFNTGNSNKNLLIKNVEDNKNSLLLINKGYINNAVEGFIKKEPIYKTCPNGITLDDQFGNCFYQDREFILTGGGHISVVLWKDKKLKEISDKNKKIYLFICFQLRKIFKKSKIFGYTYKITNDRPYREILLIPVLESNDSIANWHYGDKHYILAIDYIKNLLNKSIEMKDNNKTRINNIDLINIENKMIKLENELNKYKNNYLNELNKITWISFKLGDLFDRNSNHSIKTPKKRLDETRVRDENHTIKNITASKENNGCSGYLNDSGEVTQRKKSFLLTIASDAAYGGICFFQRDEFVSTGHSNILEFKNKKLKLISDNNVYLYLFFSKIVTKSLRHDFVNRFMRPIASDFDREIIMLPVLKVDSTKEFLWEINNKFWTIAESTASYLYINAQISKQIKLLNKIKNGEIKQ